MSNAHLSGEVHPSKISASFDDRQLARQAAEQLILDAGLDNEQIDVIEPGASDSAERVEPDTRGIRRTLVRSHVLLGLSGLSLGIVAGGGLVIAGFDLTSSSPLMTVVALGFFGAIAGLLLGGLISLRPDHDRVVNEARGSAKSGCWTVLVHAENHSELEEARTLLQKNAREVAGSI